MINFDKAQGGMSWQGSLVNGERVSRAERLINRICGVSFYAFDMINLGRRRLSSCSPGEWPGHAEEGSNYRRQ